MIARVKGRERRRKEGKERERKKERKEKREKRREIRGGSRLPCEISQVYSLCTPEEVSLYPNIYKRSKTKTRHYNG